ncbi:hypothetical protein SCLCIDRAFT_1208214 [Scleroderma citrinum Foug A]|uniref:Uncharacterized protein n=1 Tax=Scleroderma citrinum Foug A TaxID=1036808 RepID=A0A0C3EPF6_9AGAM|nr:hypothetical protein SCLCIDRAFT_1208214 [Scleroderma citrinum Foug A]
MLPWTQVGHNIRLGPGGLCSTEPLGFPTCFRILPITRQSMKSTYEMHITTIECA